MEDMLEPPRTGKIEKWREFEQISDFNVIIGNEVLKVHKALLAWRSPIFEKLLDNDQSSIEITECNSVVFKIFLNYLYNAPIEDEDISTDLLSIAEKFKVKSLIKLCGIKLCSSIITHKNAIQLLLAATFCGCKKLKRLSALYISRNLKELKKDPDFAQIYDHKEVVEAIFDTSLKDEAFIDNSESVSFWKLLKPSNLFDSKKFSDFNIIIGGEKIAAHKIILMLQMPVFRNMLQTDMIETSKNESVLNDIDAKSFKAVLKYLYTDVVEMETLTIDFLRIAHRYMLGSLINICSLRLMYYVDYFNATSLLLTFILFNVDFLKMAAADFVVMNFEEIKKTKDFENVYNNQDAVDQIFNIIGERNAELSTFYDKVVYYKLNCNQTWDPIIFELNNAFSVTITNDKVEEKILIKLSRSYSVLWNTPTFFSFRIVLFSKTHSTVYIRHKFVHKTEADTYFVDLSKKYNFDGFQYFQTILCHCHYKKM